MTGLKVDGNNTRIHPPVVLHKRGLQAAVISIFGQHLIEHQTLAVGGPASLATPEIPGVRVQFFRDPSSKTVSMI